MLTGPQRTTTRTSQTPNLRRRLALSEIDKVPFGLYREPPLSAPPACLATTDAGTVEKTSGPSPSPELAFSWTATTSSPST